MKLSELLKIMADSTFIEIYKGFEKIYKGYGCQGYCPQLHGEDQELCVVKIYTENRKVIILTQPMETTA